MKKIVFQLQFLLHVYSPILGSLADLVRDLFFLLMVSFLPSDGLTNKKTLKTNFLRIMLAEIMQFFLTIHDRSVFVPLGKIKQTRGNKPNYSVSFNHFIAWESNKYEAMNYTHRKIYRIFFWSGLFKIAFCLKTWSEMLDTLRFMKNWNIIDYRRLIVGFIEPTRDFVIGVLFV